jgi:PAS domain S-box-containing protein
MSNPFRSRGPGGLVMRGLLPAASTTILALAFLRWTAEREGIISSAAGLLIMACASLATVVALLWYFARRLDRADVQRTEMEHNLRRASRYFELSSDMVCTAGLDGFFKELNPAWTATLGWSEAELRSRPFVEFVHPDDRAATLERAATLVLGEATVSFVNRYATKSGGWRWIEWSSMANPDEQVIYASARDVTDSKAAAAALEASERRNRLILETAHDAFISFDEHGAITEWNPQAEVSFGWSREEALGRDLVPMMIPPERRADQRDRIAAYLRGVEQPWVGTRLERTVVHRDGHEFPAEMTIAPVKTGLGTCFNVFLRDITERTRFQTELAVARDEAVAASQSKSMFVANVSHEIRTPMNGVIGMTELLRDTDLDAQQREYVETISSSGESLLEIIDDILDLSKIEAGKLELDVTSFALRDAVERACGMLAAHAHQKGLELVVAIDPGAPALVRGDAPRLRQVIANLVSNAIKFTAEGEVVVRVSATPAAGGELVRVEVTDTGIGIEPDTLRTLFEPFAQADSSTTRKYGGTGLGLAISRQLIGLMGGTVEASSQPGRGSRFWFAVTLERAAADAEPIVHDDGLAGLRVLVVDDSATSRTSLERQLGSWQMRCQSAAGAGEAMTRLKAAAGAGQPYALTLLDLHMPDVDGYVLARAIRSEPALRDTRLVLMSGTGLPLDVPANVVLDGTLTKPVRQSRLREELQAALAGDGGTPSSARRPASFSGPAGGRSTWPEILVVEDTLVNQAVAVKMLEQAGFRSAVAENGRAGLAALATGCFAAVLMDCQMPELDGYETTAEIRRREHGAARIPIIAMTASSMTGERERCLAAGMDDYLMKPLRTRELNDAMRRWVSTRPRVAATSASA